MSNLNIDCRFVEFPLDLVERQYLVNNFANSHFKENLVYFVDIQINVLFLKLQSSYARNENLYSFFIRTQFIRTCSLKS